jgi:DNA translocase FtsK/SpoIIIE-like protein
MTPPRNARVGSLVEHTPVTTEYQVRYSWPDLLMFGMLRPAWAYRVELALFTAGLAAWGLLTYRFGLRGHLAFGLILVVAAILPWLPWTRATLVGLLWRSHLRRRWTLACRHAHLATINDRIPVIRRIHEVPVGERLTVRIPAGSQVPDLEDAAEPIAAFLGVRELRVARDPGNAAVAEVTVVRRDPLAAPLTEPWPWSRAGRLDLWAAGIPVGVDEDGELVCLNLAEKNLLIGGEPGAGKSVGASMLLAAAALDPRVRLLLCDGALVELAGWRRCADAFVGPDPAAFAKLLADLQAELDRRLHVLLDDTKRKVSPEHELPLIVVVIDELAFYLNTSDRRLDRDIERALRDVVARGRKTGIIVIAATQRPSHDVVPTSIRDLFAYRWAFRCTTPEASDTILGRGHASLGYSAATIDAAHRGVGWLRAEGTEPRRLRTYYLTDDHLAVLAGRAHALRNPKPGPIRATSIDHPEPTDTGEEVA